MFERLILFIAVFGLSDLFVKNKSKGEILFSPLSSIAPNKTRVARIGWCWDSRKEKRLPIEFIN